MKITTPYTLSLVLSEGKYSCVKASKVLGLVSHDRLNRELLKERCFFSWEALPSEGILVIDDTVVSKPYAPKMENVHYVWDSANNRSTLGYSVLLVLWVVGKAVYPVRVVLPGTENKNELVRQTLRELAESGLTPKFVTFDNWYAAAETLNLLEQLGWTYITRVKCNRIFNGNPVKHHHFYGAQSKTGKLKGVRHPVQIVKDGNRYLLTNASDIHNTASLKRLYKERWVIETVFRDLKQFLHLEHCSARSIQAQLNHVLACLEAYFFLKNTFQKHSVEAAQQHLLQLFRQGKSLPHLNIHLAA